MAKAVAALVAVLVVAPGASATPPADFSEQVMATGLTSPTAIAFLPDGRMLVTEKGGALKLVQGGSVSTLTTLPVCTASEMGLLGVAVHPDFASGSPYVFLYRTKPAATGCASSTGRFNQVVRVEMSGNTVVAGSLSERLTGIRTDGGNHDGGTLRIGPDEKLWVSVGDTGIGDGGAPGQSTNPYSQDRNALEGKILRLELDGITPAAGNPFIGVPNTRPEVYAYGFRNPFRMSFDQFSGKLWIGDVGQSTLEEIDIAQAGGNYSWPYCEGTLPVGCMQAGDVAPVYEYPRTGPVSGRSVTGGSFAASNFGALGGHYIFGDYVASKLWSAAPNAARDDIGTPVDFISNAGGPVDIVTGPDEAIYWVAINTGEVRRVVPNYARPKGATPVRASLVPAYTPCTSPNRNHGPPLAFGSCGPPVQRSAQLTVGTPDANTLQAKSVGFARFAVEPGDAGTPADEADVTLRVEITDVRRSSDLADYTGELQASAPIRITDRDNAATAGSTAATAQDGTFAWTVPCTATADAGIGGTCSVATSADAVTPGAIKEGMRAIWALGQVQVFDGGADGQASTTPNTLFANQGVFVP